MGPHVSRACHLGGWGVADGMRNGGAMGEVIVG